MIGVVRICPRQYFSYVDLVYTGPRNPMLWVSVANAMSNTAGAQM